MEKNKKVIWASLANREEQNNVPAVINAAGFSETLVRAYVISRQKLIWRQKLK